MLENDFTYDAFEGLEQIPWIQCQWQIEATEARIMEEFDLGSPKNTSRTIAAGIVGMLALIASVWFFTNSPTETVDLSDNKPETSSPAPQASSLPETDFMVTEEETPSDTEATNKPPVANTESTELATSNTKKTQSVNSKKLVVQDVNGIDKLAHITVGRVVDTKGIPIRNATVSSGVVTDTTDKSGYYALKIPQGSTQIIVTHLTTRYSVEINTNQNWMIVLDIADRAVKDYYPINPANRFK